MTFPFQSLPKQTKPSVFSSGLLGLYLCTLLSGTLLSGTLLSGTLLSGTLLSGTLLFGNATSDADLLSEHFQIYQLDSVPANRSLAAQTGFDPQPERLQLNDLQAIGVPVSVNRSQVGDLSDRFTWYRLAEPLPANRTRLSIRNRYGTWRVSLGQLRFWLVLGNNARGKVASAALQGWKVYEVDALNAAPRPELSISHPGIADSRAVTKLGRPRFVAIPAAVAQPPADGTTFAPLSTPPFVFYGTDLRASRSVSTVVQDAFGKQQVTAKRPFLLGVRSQILTPATDVEAAWRVYDVANVALQPPVFLRLQSVFDPYSVHATARGLTLVATGFSPVTAIRPGYSWYSIAHYSAAPTRQITIRNRYGRQQLTLGQAVYFTTPMRSPQVSAGGAVESVESQRGAVVFTSQFRQQSASNAFVAYRVLGACQPEDSGGSSGDSDAAAPGRPVLFCAPVSVKQGQQATEPIVDPDEFVTFYADRRGEISDYTFSDRFRSYQSLSGSGVMSGVVTELESSFPAVRSYPPRDLAIPNPDDKEGIRDFLESLLKSAGQSAGT